MPGLAVILGAGASFDCADAEIAATDPEWQPPLVQGLFANRRSSFNPILLKYPKAAALAPQIRMAVQQGTSLEDVLRELEEVPQDAVRRQFWEVPLYLQELLGEVSQRYAPGAGTMFDTLAREIERSKYDHVLYLTVNYDRFLERALESLYDVSFDHIDKYVERGRKWALIKLHGSVNWGRRMRNGMFNGDGVLTVNGAQLDLEGDITVLSGYQGPHRRRDLAEYYPALAAPLGGKEEFQCPRAHLSVMDERLPDCSGFLFIGFSCLDLHVVKRFAAVGRFSRFDMVNGTHALGGAAYRRLAAASPAFSNCVPEDVTSDCGFLDFVRGGHLRDFLSVI